VRSIALALAALLALSAAAARAASEACARRCESCPQASLDADAMRCLARAAACRADETLCETKLALYRAHMEELARGAELRRLPRLYRELLAPFYPGLDLARVRVGFSDRQPPDNATTDCLDIFFANAQVAERVQDAGLSDEDDIRWLLHELRHAEQCMTLGGRDFYAARWLGELGVSFVQNADLGTLHSRIPMEGDAIVRAEWVWLDLSACCVDASGRLARPSALTRAIR
jgi:hypothetical protein